MAPRPAPDCPAHPIPRETRERNERIAGAARRHHFDRLAPVPFLCECDDPGCAEVMRMTLDMYAKARDASDYLTVPGHQVDGARIVRVRDACWLFCA